MTSGLTQVHEGTGTQALEELRSISGDRLVLALTALGLIASLVAFVSFQEARSQITEEIVPTEVARSQTYYAAHAVELLLLGSAGLLALLSTNWRRIEPGYLGRFLLLIGAAVLMTARGYSFSELLSSKLADRTGPLPFILSGLVLVGAQRKNWDFLGKVMAVLAVVFSILVLLGLAGLGAFTRAEAVAKVGGPLNALLWPASWMALADFPRGSLTRRLRFVPMLIYSLGSFFTLTRLNFVMIVAFLAVYSYLQHKRRAPQGAIWIAGILMAIWVGLFVAIFLSHTEAFARVENVAEAFSARLDEDTRTAQLDWFAKSVHPEELLLGRGSFATWYWRSGEYEGGTDVGYLTLLLYGGLPLLITYVAVHLLPGLAVLRKHPTSLQLTGAGVVLLWGIRMLSSSYPSVTVEYYPILFCVGACISREPWLQRSRPPYRAGCSR